MASQGIGLIKMVFYGIYRRSTPEDVSKDLKKLGFNPCPKLEGDCWNLVYDNGNLPLIIKGATPQSAERIGNSVKKSLIVV